MFNINWSQNVGINESMDPLKWIPNYKDDGGQDINLEPYDHVIKVGRGVGRFGASAPCHLLGCQMSTYPPG